MNKYIKTLLMSILWVLILIIYHLNGQEVLPLLIKTNIVSFVLLEISVLEEKNIISLNK